MSPGEPAPRSVAARWARGVRALHKNDRDYAILLTECLASRPVPNMSPLPADPLEEALILLFSGVLKKVEQERPESCG